MTVHMQCTELPVRYIRVRPMLNIPGYPNGARPPDHAPPHPGPPTPTNRPGEVVTRVSLERETPRVTRKTLKPTMMQCTELPTRSAVLWPMQTKQPGRWGVRRATNPHPKTAPPVPPTGPGGIRPRRANNSTKHQAAKPGAPGAVAACLALCALAARDKPKDKNKRNIHDP